MKDNFNFCYVFFVSVISAFILLGISVLNTNLSITHAVNFTSNQLITNNHQQNLQSSTSNQKTITPLAGRISNDQGQINISQYPFQQKAGKIIDNEPTQTVRVGDIDIAYKQFGKGEAKPIVLITGLGATMDTWSPDLLDQLANLGNRTVIIFDNRGTGQTTTGTKDFSINQFANDTVGLLDALKIKKADILGWSMGSFIAQQVTLKNPQRVGNLILYASSCGGPNAVPPSSEVIHVFSNKSLTSQQLGQKLITLLFPSDWFKINPNYLNYFPIPQENISSETFQKQQKAIANWNGDCNSLSNIKSPTLVIVGTDDVFIPPKNSLNIVDDIPGAWLLQIKDSGHGLMYQYPQIFDNAVTMFIKDDELNSKTTR